MPRPALALALVALGLGVVAVGASPAALPAAPSGETPLIGVSLAAKTGPTQASNGSQSKPGDGGTSGSFELKGSLRGLFPGSRATVLLKIENYSSTAIRITEITARVRSVSKAGCSPDQLLLGTQGTGTVTLSLTVAGNGETTYGFPVGMAALPGRIDDSCQAATWLLDYTGKAVKA